MLLGSSDRRGREGVVVIFRLEGTLEELWEAPMMMVPRPDDRVGFVDDGITVWYKVEEVVWEFEREVIQVGGGEEPEVPVLAEFATSGTYVIVSVIP